MDHNKSASSTSPPPAPSPSPSTDPPPPDSSLMIAKEYDHALHDGDYNRAVELVEAAFSQCDADDVPSRYEAVIQQCERAWALLIRNLADPATSSVQKEKARMRLSEIIMGCKQSQ